MFYYVAGGHIIKGMKYFPCAKINLGLNVVAKRADGYHDLETVFYPVGVYDELDVRISDVPGCHLDIEGVDYLCPSPNNLVVKAYELLSSHYALPGIDVTLAKHIPTQAGMGGGSSDGAYMIRALNEVCSLGMSTDQMQQYASQLGADCPFFITSQPAYAEGIGDKLSPINFSEQSYPLEHHNLILIKPDVAVSTREAYSDITPHSASHNCREVVESMPISEWRGLLTNDFEDSIFVKLPILKAVKDAMYASGATYASMSGSGSTIYGLFPDTINQHDLLTQSNISQYANKYFFQFITQEAEDRH